MTSSLTPTGFRNIGEHQRQYEEALTRLCESEGYGNVMATASRLWAAKCDAEKMPRVNFRYGPCEMFTMPCTHPLLDETGHCPFCCGSGWLTKRVAEILDQQFGFLQQNVKPVPIDGETLQSEEKGIYPMENITPIINGLALIIKSVRDGELTIEEIEQISNGAVQEAMGVPLEFNYEEFTKQANVASSIIQFVGFLRTIMNAPCPSRETPPSQESQEADEKGQCHAG